MGAISDYCKRVHDYAVAKGWWDGGERSFGDQVTNFHGELSEAWEEYRVHGLDPAKFLYDNPDGELALLDPETGELLPKPEGIAAEFADTLIRIFDTCAAYDIPLEEAIEKKMRYNDLRSHRHGNKKA